MAEQSTLQAKPKVFIGSSTSGLEIARDIQINLRGDTEPRVWKQEDWINKATLERLVEILNDYQFGIFVLRPDDLLEIKGETLPAVRDNVLFELGLFMGGLGRERVFMVVQGDEKTDAPKLRIPTDLLGINFAIYTSDSAADLESACSIIRKKMLEIWESDQLKRSVTEDNPIIYEAGTLYMILNAASSPRYKPIDYSYLFKPYTPLGELSLSKIKEVRMIAERLFYYYMLPHLKAAQRAARRLRVHFAYYLGDGAPLDYGHEPFYCLGKDDSGERFEGAFIIGISTSEESTETKWKSGLPLKGYDTGPFSKALSNAAAAFREVQAIPIDNTDSPPLFYKHLNFKVEDEKAVYSVPVLLSEINWNVRESNAPIGILTISGSHPNMITEEIKKRAEHLAILLGFIFYLHVEQNRDELAVAEDIGVTKIPIGFERGANVDFMRRTVALRREVAKHFEEYFIREGIHKLEGDELIYAQPS